MVINFNPKYIPGDIVYNHKKEIIRITSSYLKGTKLFYYRDGECGWIREDAIKPIPLTPEILEKNGVEVWEHDLLTKDYSVIYEVGYEGCGFKASIKGEDEFDLNLVAVCKYDCICGNKFDRKEGEKNDEEKNI